MARSAAKYLIGTVGFGFLWGCGIIGFGIGVTKIGLSLGFSIIISLSALLGSLVPLVAQRPEELIKPGGLIITLGVLICTAGIAACGRAGVLRERVNSAAQDDRLPRASGTLAQGLLVCVDRRRVQQRLEYRFQLWPGDQGRFRRHNTEIRLGWRPWPFGCWCS